LLKFLNDAKLDNKTEMELFQIIPYLGGFGYFEGICVNLGRLVKIVGEI
jgi:hypothetical protein